MRRASAPGLTVRRLLVAQVGYSCLVRILLLTCKQKNPNKTLGKETLRSAFIPLGYFTLVGNNTTASVMNASTTQTLTTTLVLGAEAQDSLSRLFLNTSELFERTLDRLPDVASKVCPSHSCHEWLVSA